MTTEPYYSDEWVTLYHGEAEDVLPQLAAVDHFIADPPYSEHVHSSARSRRMQSANDRGGRYGADLRRNVDLGFVHLSDELRTFLAQEATRLTRRWVLVFSDTESAHLWAEELAGAGLDYVRTGIWVKRGATPQFSGDRPATGHETITICHPTGRKRWNGGGSHAVWDVPIVLNRARAAKSERIHPTQKPLKLMQLLVDQFTDPGELILDPTAGGQLLGWPRSSSSVGRSSWSGTRRIVRRPRCVSRPHRPRSSCRSLRLQHSISTWKETSHDPR